MQLDTAILLPDYHMLVPSGDSECQAPVWVLLLHRAPTAWPVRSAHVPLPICPAPTLMAAWSVMIVWALEPLQGWAVSLSVWVAGLSTSSRQWGTVFLGK